MNVMKSGIDFFGEGIDSRGPNCGCGCYSSEYATAETRGIMYDTCWCLCGCTGELKYEYGPAEATWGETNPLG